MYSDIFILTLEILFCLGTSIAILLLLKPVLLPLLEELCHGKTRGLFWLTFTRLMLVIAPLLMVLLYSHSLVPGEPRLALILRDVLLHTLLGQFIALGTVGIVLIRFAKHEQRHRVVELPARQTGKEN